MILTKETVKTHISKLPTKETAKRPVRYVARFLDANKNVVHEFKSVSAEKAVDEIYSKIGWWNESNCKTLAIIPVVSKRVRKAPAKAAPAKPTAFEDASVFEEAAAAPAPKKKLKPTVEVKNELSSLSVLDSAIEGYIVLDCLKNIPA